MGRVFGGLLTFIGLIALVAVGAFLVLRRADIPYETLAARYESPASRYVELADGVRVHYRDEGQLNGPALLLVHGFSASLETWAPWIERLSDEYRLISIDLPGHGLTSAPPGYDASIESFAGLVEAFAQAQHFDRFAIAGNSMGGNVAWEYALAHPERVDALVLIDSAGWIETETEQNRQPIGLGLLRNPVTGPLLRELDSTLIVRQGLQTAFADPALATEANVTRYVEFSRAPGHREILLRLMADRSARTPASAERLAPITAPTLIIWGDRDNLIPPRHAELFRTAIAGAEVLMLENIGHLPQEEAADATADAVREFLYQTYEGSALAAE
jgi:pimeloyl-ACP methyl ester carboxylesterase